MPAARAIELHLGDVHAGHARLEVVSEDPAGERFVIQVDGPEHEVRAEADFLAAQYGLETVHDLRAGSLVTA